MSTETLWIVVAVVVAVLLIAVVLGLVIGRRRRINLREGDEQKGVETGEKEPPKGGSYQAGGGFSFAAGTATAPERPTTPAPKDRTPTGTAPPAGTAPTEAAPGEAAPGKAAPGEKAPEDGAPGRAAAGAAGVAGAAAAGAAVAGSAAAPERPTEAPDRPATPPAATPPTTTPPTEAAPPAATAPAAAAADPATGTAPAPADEEDTRTADDVRTPPRGTPIPDGATEARTPPSGIPVVDAPTPPRGTPVVRDSPVIDTREASKDPETRQLDTRAAAAPAEPATRETPVPPATPAPTAPADTTTPIARPDTTAPTDTAPAGTAPADTAPAAPAGTAPAGTTTPTAPAEEIPSAEGRLNRLRGRLSRSRTGLGQSLLGLLGAGQMDEESWEDVEATLLQADLGPEMTEEVVEKLREQLAARAVRTAEGARAVLHDVLSEALDAGQDRSVRALPHDGRPAVLLVVGVNGTGKTTTTGKLARVLVGGGHTVTLGAADTFRAAAAEQLVTWGQRAGAGVVRGPEGSDPASVAFDAVKRGTEDGVDAVLLDTAGRLHTKTGLMDELGKVKRVVEKQAEVDEVLLVLDATTGQNGLTQARVFGDVVKVTGIALTKLDGTAKGGIVFRVQRELGVPVKLVGLGEGPDDLAPFEPKAFVDALLD